MCTDFMPKHVLVPGFTPSSTLLKSAGQCQQQGDRQANLWAEGSHLLIGGEFTFEQDEQPAVAEVEVGGLLALLQSWTDIMGLLRRIWHLHLIHTLYLQKQRYCKSSTCLRSTLQIVTHEQENSQGCTMKGSLEGQWFTRKDVSWGSRMAMRLLRPTSCTCMPLQSVWKLACAKATTQLRGHPQR